MKDNVTPVLTAEEHARRTATQFDSRLHAALAKASSGLSPISLALAGLDWALHLASQPAQATRLATAAQQSARGHSERTSQHATARQAAEAGPVIAGCCSR